eukprot:6809473-Alexandrium_andersonii.AAC.1
MFRDVSGDPKDTEDAGAPAQNAATLLKIPFLNKRFCANVVEFHTAEQLCQFSDTAGALFNAPWSDYCSHMAKMWQSIAAVLRKKTNAIEVNDASAAASVSGRAK